MCQAHRALWVSDSRPLNLLANSLYCLYMGFPLRTGTGKGSPGSYYLLVPKKRGGRYIVSTKGAVDSLFI